MAFGGGQIGQGTGPQRLNLPQPVAGIDHQIDAAGVGEDVRMSDLPEGRR